MRARLRVGFAVPLAAALALACASTPAPPAETGQLFLWEVARADGRGGIAHVLGSVHVSQESVEFDPAVERAFRESDTIVLEVDPRELEPSRMAVLTAEKAQFQDGRTLDQVLSAETWAALSVHLAARRLPVSMFRRMEPWSVLLTLQMLALEDEGYRPDQGVETTLTQVATQAGKPMRGLESAADQLDVFDSLPLAFQDRMLHEFLVGAQGSGREEGAETMALLMDAWQKGDEERVEAELFEELERDPSLEPYFERLYFERNRHMASGIAELVDGGGAWFVAVGAGHVVGARGIPSLLSARGYAVRRVPKTRD